MPVRAESSTKPPVAPGASTRMKSARLRGKAERGRKAGAVGGGPAGADVSPVKAPQTKSGEAQTLRRRARNRISAKLHRAKQRKHLRDMEARLAATTRERDALRCVVRSAGTHDWRRPHRCLLVLAAAECACLASSMCRANARVPTRTARSQLASLMPAMKPPSKSKSACCRSWTHRLCRLDPAPRLTQTVPRR